MYWIISVLIGSLKKITQRKILIKANPLAYASLFNILSSIFLSPLFLIEVKKGLINISLQSFSIVLISSILWALIAWMSFLTYKLLEVSKREPISKIRLIFVVIFSFLLFGEPISTIKIAGILLILFGSILASKELETFKFDYGVLLLIILAILIASVEVVDFYGMKFFSPNFYSFFVYLIPGLLLLSLSDPKELYIIIKEYRFLTLVPPLFSAFEYYFKLWAYKEGILSIIYPLLELNIPLTIFLGTLIFREKEPVRRLIAGVIVMFGCLFLKVYG